jgi:hypothetical protein
VSRGGADLGFCPPNAPATFVHAANEWLAARTVVSLEEADAWLASATVPSQPPAGGEPGALTAGLGGIPAFTAALRPPSALVQIFPKTDVSSANFLAAAVRAARGLVGAVKSVHLFR